MTIEYFCVGVIEDAKRMHILVKRIEGGLRPMRTILENHIYRQGTEAIEAIKEKALTVRELFMYI